MLRLGRAGIVGAAFVSMIAGLTLLIGSLLTRLLGWAVATLPTLPIAEKLVLGIGFDSVRLLDIGFGRMELLLYAGFVWRQVPVYSPWTAFLTAYSSVFGVGRLAQGGVLHSAYSLVRTLLLILTCCLVSFVMEQTLEVVLKDWPVFQSFGGYLLWLSYGAAGGAVLLGMIFATTYHRDQMPVFLISLRLALWFAQVVLLSGILSLVGGVVDVWVGALLRLFPGSGAPQGLYGMPWHEVPALAGSYLGFFAGVGRALFNWARGDLGMVVAKYREVVQRYCSLVDFRMGRLIELRERWWVTVGFGVAAIAAIWRFFNLMAPALTRRF